MTTALLFLAGQPAAIGEAITRVAFPPDAATWAALRADDDPMATTEYGSQWPYTGFISIEFDDMPHDGVATAVGEVFDTLGSSVDRSKSTVIIGDTHRIIDGRTDVALVYVIHRVAGLTVEQYQDHWLNRHGPLAKELVRTSGYEQTHADHDAGSKLAATLGLDDADFDGNASCFFGSRQDFVDMLEAREGSLDMNVIYEDEKRFLDHRRSLGALMRRVASTERGS